MSQTTLRYTFLHLVALLIRMKTMPIIKIQYSEEEIVKMTTKLVPAICTQCNGSVEVDPSQEKTSCKYCGTSFFVEHAINSYNVQHANIERVESINIHNNKRGAVESVLNFIENQQNKKQQKEEEEKRRLEEEKRKQEEQLREIKNQIFNKKYRKRNLITIGAVAIFIFIISMMGANREKPSHDGEAKTPGGSSYHQGRDFKDVVSDFENNGFTNIKIEKLEDLITGWLTKDGEVESVSVDGSIDYSANSWYPNDAEVIITYHTFPDKEADNLTEEENTENIESLSNTNNSVTEENSQNNSPMNETNSDSTDNEVDENAEDKDAEGAEEISQNDDENSNALTDSNSDSTNTTEASIYEKGYGVRLSSYDIYYLIDEDAKTISIFDTVDEYTVVYVSGYSGDFNNKIDFDWNGLKMWAHYKYVDQDATLMVYDESGNELEATKLTVEIVESNINTR